MTRLHHDICFVVVMLVGDGRLGYPEGAPYDAIHVGAAAPTLPKAVSTLPTTTQASLHGSPTIHNARTMVKSVPDVPDVPESVPETVPKTVPDASHY